MEEVKYKLQQDLDNIMNWLCVNRLSLNVGKTKSLIFSTRQYRGSTVLELNVGGEMLEQVDLYKYLGVFLDRNLNFVEHIDYIVNKSRRKLGMLKRICKFMNQETTLMLYKTLIVPLFDYGDIIYMNTTAEQMDRLQKLQNVACRTIL